MIKTGAGVGAKRILVLGSTGRVGRLLRLAWARNSPEKVELVLQSRDATGVAWQPGQPIPFGQVDAVIALWGVTHGDAEALAMNAELALIAQQIGAECGATRVLHCSSIAAYAPKNGPLTEADLAAPTNPYGQAKFAMEQAVAQAGGPASACLRIGSVVGAESLANNMRQGWSSQAETLTLDRFADGKGPARSYISPTDLAHVLLTLATAKDVPSVINAGAPDPVHMEALLQAADHPMQWRDAPENARQYAVMECSQLASLTDLSPKASDAKYMIQDWLTLEGRI